MTGAGPDGDNLLLLEVLARTLYSMNLPFICGGDFQMTPAQLRDTGWPDRMHAVVVATGEPTYRSAGILSESDFFLVHKALLPMLDTTSVIEESPVAKHFPVVATFRSRVEVDVLINKVRKLTLQPAADPIGCRPYDDGEMELILPAIHEGNAAEVVSAYYGEWVTKASQELLALYGIEDEHPDLRSSPPQIVRRPLLPRGA